MRYLIRNANHGPVVYVATDAATAAHLRDLVAGKLGKATIHGPDDVEPLHRNDPGGWVLWSDGKMTTAIGLHDATRPRSLTQAAEQLITLARGSDSREPEVGWAALTEVQRVVERTVVEQGGPNGYYQPRTVERIVVEMRDGSTQIWLQTTVGYFEGYQCEIVPEPMPEAETESPGPGSVIETAADLYDAIAERRCRVVDTLRGARDDGTIAKHSPGALIGLICGSIYGWVVGEDRDIYKLNGMAYDAALQYARHSDAVRIHELPECGLATWPGEDQVQSAVALARAALAPDDPWWRCGWTTPRAPYLADVSPT
jgi:hypothetical protein